MTQTAVGLSTEAQTEIVDALNQSVAETVVTTMLAQNFHWNVTGMALVHCTRCSKRFTKTILLPRMTWQNGSKRLMVTPREHWPVCSNAQKSASTTAMRPTKR